LMEDEGKKCGGELVWGCRCCAIGEGACGFFDKGKGDEKGRMNLFLFEENFVDFFCVEEFRI